MLSQIFLVAAFGLYFLHAVAQSTLQASSCQVGAPYSLDPACCLADSGISTFSACNYLSSQLAYCAGPQVASGAPDVACYCNQQVFNAFYDCESEINLCVGNDDSDGVWQADINLWHSGCDDRITFSPTTPVVSNPTVTYNQDFCMAAYSSCASATELASQCALSYTNFPQLSSCYCQPELLSLQYTCLYQVNTSCLGSPAALTKIPAYTFCDNAASVLGSAGSLPSAAPASGTSSLLSSTDSAASFGSSNAPTVTRPALPGSSSVNTGAQSTSSTKSSGKRVSASMRTIGIVAGAIAVWEAGFIIA